MADGEGPERELVLAYAVITQYKDTPTNPNTLALALNLVKPVAYQNGLDSECFNDLVTILCTKDLSPPLYSLLLEILIPSGPVHDDVIDVMMRLCFSKIWTNEDLCGKLLTWFSVVIYCGLADLNNLRIYFDLLIRCLKIAAFIHPLVLVLRGLLQPFLITPRTVHLAKHYYEEHDHSREILFLLHEMKNLRPETVTEVFPQVKPLKPRLKKEMFGAFTKVAARCGSEIGLKTINNIVTKNIDLAPLSIKGTDKPPNGISIFAISSLEELAKNWDRLILPDNLLSLTQNEFGIFVLMSGNPDLEWRIEAHLNGLKSYKEILYPLLSLSNMCLCGLPGVSKYILRNLLLTWDGFKDSQLIFPLLKWTWFNNYEDLRKLILLPLARIYVSVGSERKTKIIGCLKDLMVNMIAIELERTSKCLKRPFGTTTMAWLEQDEALTDTLNKMFLAVQKLIVTGILMESLNPSPILLEGLLFYEEVSKLIVEKSLLCFPHLPTALVYGSIFSSNFLVIRKLCSLLSFYISTVLPHFEDNGSPDFAGHIQDIRDYSADVYSFIWSGKVSESKFAAHANIPVDGVCLSLSIKNHQALFPAVHFFAKKSNLPLSSISDETLLELLSNISGEVAGFIHLQANNIPS